MKTHLLSLTLAITSLLSAYASDWNTDYKAALEQARVKHRLVLLDFTGSDWCGGCKLLDKEVLAQPEFHHYADRTFILVTIDFPHGTQLSDELKRQNTGLKQEFQTHVFPTLLVIDPEGRELGRKAGYRPGSGPQVVINALKKFSKN